MLNTFSTDIDSFTTLATLFGSGSQTLQRSFPDIQTINDFSDTLAQYESTATQFNAAKKGSSAYTEASDTLIGITALLSGISLTMTWSARQYSDETSAWLAAPPHLQMPDKPTYNKYLSDLEQIRQAMVSLASQIEAAVSVATQSGS